MARLICVTCGRALTPAIVPGRGYCSEGLCWRYGVITSRPDILALLLTDARELASRHNDRIGYWSSSVGDSVTAGLAMPDEASAMLDRACTQLVGAWGLSRLPSDVDAWMKRVEAALAGED